MAGPSYATDLATCNLTTGTWGEFTGAASGSAPTENDTDNFIAGVHSTTEAVRASGLSSMYAPANTVTVASGDASFHWLYFASMPNMATFALDGFTVAIGSGTGDYYKWTVAGRDSLPYGGWFSVAVDPATTDRTQIGSPSGTTTYFGSVIDLDTGISKGNAFANDYIRHGRSLIVTVGDGTTPGTFAGAAAANDAVAARWGLFAEIPGGYSQKGLFSFGSGTTAVYFEDSDKNIVIEDTIHCAAGFNEFEVLDATSTVLLTGIQISALGTQSPGLFTVTDNATVTITGCTFNDMGVFSFLTNTDAVESVFRRCGQVTFGGATMTDSAVTGYEGTAGTAATIWNTALDPNGELDGMTFVKGTAATHAIEFTSASPASVTLTDQVYTSYNASNGQNDSTFYNNTSGALTITITNGSGNTTYRNGTSATTTISVSYTVTVTCKDSAGDPIEGIAVRVETDPAGALLGNGTTNSSGIYTFAHTGSVPQDVKVIARQKAYRPNQAFDTISATGLGVGFTMIDNPVVNMP